MCNQTQSYPRTEPIPQPIRTIEEVNDILLASANQQGLMGPEENLMDIIAEDEATMARLGITHKQMSDQMSYLLFSARAKRNTARYRMREEKLGWSEKKKRTREIKETYFQIGEFSVKVFSRLDTLPCPWDGASFNTEESAIVLNTRTATEMHYSGENIHAIEKHHFYGGKQATDFIYGKPLARRVDPAHAAMTLNILPGVDYSHKKE